jgi:hypothetical protein
VRTEIFNAGILKKSACVFSYDPCLSWMCAFDDVNACVGTISDWRINVSLEL